MIKALFFDFDGVICDTEPAFFEYKFKKMNEMGYPVTREFLHKRIGESFRVMFPREFKCDNPEEVIEEYYAGIEESIVSYKELLYPTIVELLDYCRDHNILLYVTSNSKHNRLLHALEELEIIDYFKGIYSNELVGVAKPDPMFYKKIAEMEHLTSDEVLVIEDSVHGIDAAKDAGFTTIAIAEHNFNIDQSKADKIVENHNEIISILKGL